MGTQRGAFSDAFVRQLDSRQRDAWPSKQLYVWAALLVAGLVLLLVLKLFPTLDLVILHDPVIHVLIAGSAAVLGVVLALLVLSVAHRANDGRVFLIGAGFLSIASILIVHAVATPSVLMTGGGLATSWSSVASLLVGSIFFVLSSLNLPIAVNRWLMRHVRTWLLIFCVCWFAYTYVCLIVLPAASTAELVQVALPESSPTQPAHSQTEHVTSSVATAMPTPQAAASAWNGARASLVLVGLVCFSFATWRYWTLYRRLPSSTGLATAVGMAFFGEALLTQQMGIVYGISFWLYHAQEFAGFGIISYAMLVAYRRGQTEEGLLESLFLPGTRARIQAASSQAMDALVDALERGEQPTQALSLMLKRQFGMTESQVHVLERAAGAVAKERQQRQELEQLNAELRQLEQAKTNFTQMLVHDLKTPLTSLIGYIEILWLGAETDDQRMLVEGALRSGKNLSGLIDNLLDISRLEEGRLELMRVCVEPRTLFAECAAEVHAWLDQEAKMIQIEVPNEQLLFYVDVQMIRRVIRNLVSNAIKHTPPGTHITLRAYRSAAVSLDNKEHNVQQVGAPRHVASIILEIEDNGSGIAPEYLGKIFDKFEQKQGARQVRQSSTGLGLTFCRLAVEAHCGTITVESAVDVGTTFRVVLPVMESFE